MSAAQSMAECMAAVRLELPAAEASALLELLRPGAWLDVDRAFHIEVGPADLALSQEAALIADGWRVFAVRQYGRAASLARQRPAAPTTQPVAGEQGRAWARVAALASIEREVDVWCGDCVVAMRRHDLGQAWRAWTVIVRPRREWER